MIHPEEFWQMEKSLADCYPLPDFQEALGIPLFLPERVPPLHAKNAPLVEDQDFSLWLAHFTQQYPLEGLLRSNRLGDLRRLWDYLEKAHSRVHVMIEHAARDAGEVVVGTYLTLTIMHAGVEKLMEQTLAKIGKHV